MIAAPWDNPLRAAEVRRAESALRRLRGREPVDGPMAETSSVRPRDAVHAGTDVRDVDQEAVAWSASVKSGVRVEVVLGVASDGEVDVESFRVTDVCDDGDAAGHSSRDGQVGDVPVGGSGSIVGPSSEPAGEFGASDRDDRGRDGDDDAAPEVHDADGTRWAAAMGSIWDVSQRVRLSLHVARGGAS